MRRSQTMISGESTLVIPGDTASIALSRSFVRGELGDVDQQRADDVTLAASELVTNAIQYGSGDDIEIAVRRGDEGVELFVSATSLGLPEPRSEPVGVTALRGRGLQIVASLSDHVAVSVAGDVVTVMCRFDFAPGES